MYRATHSDLKCDRRHSKKARIRLALSVCGCSCCYVRNEQPVLYRVGRRDGGHAACHGASTQA